MKNILIYGPPGSGKGTQSKILSKEFGLKHIDTGGLIREEIVKGTKFGLYAQTRIDQGHLVPDEVLIPQVREWIISAYGGGGIIFDGYPRSIAQAKDIDKFLMMRKTPINCFLFLEVPKEVVRERLAKRGETSGREDDKPEYFETRYGHYLDKFKPIYDYFDNKNLIIKIDANNPIEKVTEEIRHIVKSM